LLYRSPGAVFENGKNRRTVMNQAALRAARNTFNFWFPRATALIADDLTAGFNLSGNQADFIHAGGMSDVNHISHIGKWHIVIPFDEHYFLSTRLENVGQPSL
jgi:hypothetical protein